MTAAPAYQPARTPSTCDEEIPPAIAPERLYRKADLSALPFDTTRELAPLPGLLGQDRAQQAIHLSANVAAAGFNIFAVGANGTRLSRLVRHVLATGPSPTPKLTDWVYVNNLDRWTLRKATFPYAD